MTALVNFLQQRFLLLRHMTSETAARRRRQWCPVSCGGLDVARIRNRRAPTHLHQELPLPLTLEYSNHLSTRSNANSLQITSDNHDTLTLVDFVLRTGNVNKIAGGQIDMLCFPVSW